MFLYHNLVIFTTISHSKCAHISITKVLTHLAGRLSVKKRPFCYTADKSVIFFSDSLACEHLSKDQLHKNAQNTYFYWLK